MGSGDRRHSTLVRRSAEASHAGFIVAPDKRELDAPHATQAQHYAEVNMRSAAASSNTSAREMGGMNVNHSQHLANVGELPVGDGNSHGDGTGLSTSGSTSSVPAPTAALLFERLVSEEVKELKAYARIIESQDRRLAELQRIHDDLEGRLEVQTRQRMELETLLEIQQRDWAEKFENLEKERDGLKGLVQTERTTNLRLLDLVNQKEKEIHRMIQRKYDSAKNPDHHNTRDQPSPQRGMVAPRSAGSHIVARGESLSVQNRSPHEILAASGSVEVVRERNATNSLLDFFGL